MVTKAIERAQNTVEGRNAEIRKDVLKYDEVMNEQRKVIYAPAHADHRRRGPRATTPRSCSRRPSTELVARRARRTSPRSGTCRASWPRSPSTTRPSSRSTSWPRRRPSPDHREPPRRGARPLRTTRDETIPRRGDRRPGQLERDIMLQIIDQRWQDHLAEMDYLREGINLRADGQPGSRSWPGSARASPCSAS